jgi:hypothetical protein
MIKIKCTRNIILFSWLLLGINFSYAQQKEHILMVGNSFTFYYNLPMTIEQFAKTKGLKWKIDQSTASGATFKQHLQNKKGLKTTQRLKRKKYTQIIFQEHSIYPITAIDTTQKYFKKLLRNVPNNTKKHLYATWAYPKLQYKQNEVITSNSIEKALSTISPQSDISILPVGRAFDLFQSRYPNQTLFTSDKKHPNPIGSYLAACVIFSKISGLSPLGLNRRVASKPRKGKTLYYFIVEKKMADKCQRIADEIVFNH